MFKEDGTITAGNSSSISDGAAVLLLTSAAFAQEHKLKVLARICGFGDAAQVSFLLQFIPWIAMVAAHMHNKHSSLYLSLFNFILGKKDKERIERTKDNSDVATGVNHGVASFLSWSKYVILRQTFENLVGPKRLLPPFEGEHLELAQTSWLAPISP